MNAKFRITPHDTLNSNTKTVSIIYLTFDYIAHIYLYSTYINKIVG